LPFVEVDCDADERLCPPVMALGAENPEPVEMLEIDEGGREEG